MAGRLGRAVTPNFANDRANMRLGLPTSTPPSCRETALGQFFPVRIPGTIGRGQLGAFRCPRLS